jgi:catechol 2,3-dioxygenase-like lactoylglutathione lyase family enzyme
MPIRKLAHPSVRTTALDQSRKFYTDVLGFRDGFRPPFKFPGHWLLAAAACSLPMLQKAADSSARGLTWAGQTCRSRCWRA